MSDNINDIYIAILSLGFKLQDTKSKDTTFQSPVHRTEIQMTPKGVGVCKEYYRITKHFHTIDMYRIDHVVNNEPYIVFNGRIDTVENLKLILQLTTSLPMKKESLWNIWMSGFMVEGMDSPAKASCLTTEGDNPTGPIKASSFDDAVEIYIKLRPTDLYRKNRDGIHTIWGCVLYDNEADARKGFG